jgi:rhamnogalacturonan endolyase
MTQNIMRIYFLLLLSPFVCFTQSSLLDGFVLIKGGTFKSGDVVTQQNRPTVRVDDFEILDHPVTNKEYKRFIDATGFHAPLHWENNQIPAGKDEYPVIYINRYDVQAYLKWLTEKEGRVYRLPKICEFEYASRGGLVDKKYPWGDQKPKGLANYDEKLDRTFDQWAEHLKPAKLGKPNGYGLYNMSGNVWHLTVNLLDPATVRFKYRIKNVPVLEGSRMGGSWARGAEYLTCGNVSEFSSGIRHPDAGFRPIRSPKGADWKIQPRKLCAVLNDSGNVFLSWAISSDDTRDVRFNVYRTTTRNHSGFLQNKKPIASSSSFVDENVEEDKRYHYYVKTVDKKGKEGRRSEWTGITIKDQTPGELVSFFPVVKQGSLTPIFGDLNNDGSLDCVIRLSNGNHEESQNPGLPVQLEAFSSFGRSLWRKNICDHDHCYGSANNVPFNVWDMDSDGKAEIITRMQIGDTVYVAIIDGLTGVIKNKIPWSKMETDNQRSSTRIHMSIAYLDGVNPAIITQTGLYENEVFVAFDANLNKLWQFDSFAETNGSAGHKIEVADVDSDGKQEIFDGTTCLNPDGTVRWSIYRQHPDIVSIHDYLPDRPGLEVFYIVESNAHAGIYMVDANSGEVIWKINREDDPRWTHGHVGWTADIWEGSPGIECVSNRGGHGDPTLVLFSATGKHLLEPFPQGYYPVEWNGDATREMLSAGGHKIGKFEGNKVVNWEGVEPNKVKNSGLLMVADLYGDFRDELVLQKTDKNGQKAISVVTSTLPVDKMFVTPTTNLDYRLWIARNMGGGYRSIYDQLLIPLK